MISWYILLQFLFLFYLSLKINKIKSLSFPHYLYISNCVKICRKISIELIIIIICIVEKDFLR